MSVAGMLVAQRLESERQTRLIARSMQPTVIYSISPELHFEGFCRFLIASIMLSARGDRG